MSGRIETGTFVVEAKCPECGGAVELLARLSSVLTVAQDEGASVRLKLKGEKVPHACRNGSQLSLLRDGSGLRVNVTTGEVTE
jgi:hypothetical protein